MATGIVDQMTSTNIIDKSTLYDVVDLSTIYDAPTKDIDPNKTLDVVLGVMDDDGFFITGDDGETILEDH